MNSWGECDSPEEQRLTEQLAAVTKERDEAHAVVHSHAWTIGRLQFDNARLRAALDDIIAMGPEEAGSQAPRRACQALLGLK